VRTKYIMQGALLALLLMTGRFRLLFAVADTALEPTPERGDHVDVFNRAIQLFACLGFASLQTLDLMHA
jgi:hypothetical protein